MEEYTGLKDFIKETLHTIGSALILTLIIYYLIATPNRVQGASMLPNVEDGDIILTNRTKHLLSNTSIAEKFGWQYDRGQVVIFKLPGEEAFIKRIVGLPGDQVTLLEKHLVVNGKIVDEEYIPDNVPTIGGDFLKENEVRTVPEDSYLVFGDNRTNSLDSRYLRVGFIKHKYIIGQATLRVFPFRAFGIIPEGEFTEEVLPKEIVETFSIDTN